jgi:hypothetical protein
MRIRKKAKGSAKGDNQNTHLAFDRDKSYEDLI